MSRLASLVLCLVASTGCATIVAPRSTSIYVTSNVPDAEIRVDGQLQGKAPATVNFDRKRTPNIQVSAPGYQTSSCRPRMSPGALYVVSDVAMCLVAFPLGCIAFIDADGAWNDSDSASCSVDLSPVHNPIAAYQAPVPASYAAPAGYQLVPVAAPPPPPPAGYTLVPLAAATR